MGRKKIVIKRLAEDRNRNVTFLKRKAGLMKKAWELSVLCGAEVSVIVFNSAGKLFEFSSAETVEKAIDRYHAYSGPVERRKPEEFAAQQASGGGDNSDDEEDVPAASSSGINSGGAPITASGNMSLRGRDEWKEVTVPSYEHLSSPVVNGEQLQRISSSRDGGKPSTGPVDPRLTDPRLYNRSGTAMSASSFPPDHDANLSNYRLHARDSEEIMEQQRRSEQYRYLQMQAQLSNGFPPYPNHGNAPGHMSMAPNAPLSWMGVGRNRQRSDIGDGLDMARGEQVTSWAGLRETRTPSVASLPMTGGSQPALNALYSHRLNAHSQGQVSPTGPLPHAGGSDTASHGIPSSIRHGLPEENISAGEFADPSIGSGIDFYTPYHLPATQGMNQDGTLDWQRTAAAAQLQAALQTQQAQLAYLRQQKAQQMQWKDLVAASGMDYAVNHFNGRLGNQNNERPGMEHGQYTPQDQISFQPSTDSASGGSTSAPPPGGFPWPTDGQGSAQAGSWFNNLNQQPSALRTNARVPGGSSPIGLNGGAPGNHARDSNVPASHASAGWAASEAPGAIDASSPRGDQSSISAGQDDAESGEAHSGRKRQHDGDASDVEVDGKRSRVA